MRKHYILERSWVTYGTGAYCPVIGISCLSFFYSVLVPKPPLNQPRCLLHVSTWTAECDWGKTGLCDFKFIISNFKWSLSAY